MNKKKKVVFTFVEAGFGHIMPAQAISDAFEKKYGDECEVVRWKIFSENDSPIVKDYANNIFSWTKKVTNNKILFLGEIMSYWIGSKQTLKILDKKFKKAKEIVMNDILQMNPDLICNTYYSPSHFAIECKKKKGLDAIVATYTPDPIVYPAWDRDGDLFFVNCEQTYQRALKSGFKEETLRKVPFVLRAGIAETTTDKKLSRHNLGLKEDKFTIIFANGAYGTPKDKKILKEILKANLDINLVVICGKNEEFLKFCKSINQQENSKTSFYPIGFTNRMFEYNSASNLFIGKSGANAMLESYYFGVPTIITNHANPLETQIAKYYINKKGCGEQIFSPRKIVKYIETYMKDIKLQQHFANHLQQYCDSSGAEKVADELYKALKSKEEK